MTDDECGAIGEWLAWETASPGENMLQYQFVYANPTLPGKGSKPNRWCGSPGTNFLSYARLFKTKFKMNYFQYPLIMLCINLSGSGKGIA
jgi:hypothetical protein